MSSHDPQASLPASSGSASPQAPALPPLQALLYEDLVRGALREDLGRSGDLTSDAIIPAGVQAVARLVARQEGRIAGLDVFSAAFRLLDPRVSVRLQAEDGRDAAAGATLAVVAGPARSLLSAERVALNFLGRLSGVATATRGMVEAARPWGARVVCTRKTTPLLRALEKYAVRAGGGHNHRFGLDDAILIKDNHRHVAGGVRPAVERARAYAGHLVRIELEVETLEQLAEALEMGVDAVLLDNMDLDTLRAAVALAKGRALTEASGGLRPERVAAVAATGVDLLSAGWLTHSAPVLDVALDIDTDGGGRWV